jgi:hypothetical protein
MYNIGFLMTYKTATSERLAVIETDICYIKKSLARLEDALKIGDSKETERDTIRVMDLATLTKELTMHKQFCREVQTKKTYGLNGRDKTLIYVALITSVGLALVEFLKNL